MKLKNVISIVTAMRQVRSVPSQDAGRIRQRQSERLVRLLEYACARSPFYRQRFSGLNPRTVPLELLPTVTKEEIRDNFDNVVTDPRLRWQDLETFTSDERNLGRWYLGEYAVAHSSGTQGRPLFIVHDRFALARIIALMTARSSRDGTPSTLQGIGRLFRPQRITAISFRRGFYPSGMVLEYLPEMLSPFVRMTRLSSLDLDLCAKLIRSNPQVITGYAGVLEGLAIQHGPFHFPELQYITTSSEQLLPRARKRIEAAFGVPVFDHYGTGECLQLADGCRHCGGVHVNSDWAILESVDDRGRPVPHETVGARILITNLANRVQPVIRYEVGDQVAVAARGCGPANNLPLLTQIHGRTSDLLWIGTGADRRFVSGILFQSAMDALPEIQDWRIVQQEPHRLQAEVQLIPEQRTEATHLAQRLSGTLYERGLPSGVQVEMKIVPAVLPDERTGKVRRIVPLVQEPTP